jgi:hypothetical protein
VRLELDHGPDDVHGVLVERVVADHDEGSGLEATLDLLGIARLGGDRLERVAACGGALDRVHELDERRVDPVERGDRVGQERVVHGRTFAPVGGHSEAILSDLGACFRSAQERLRRIAEAHLPGPKCPLPPYSDLPLTVGRRSRSRPTC